MRRGRRRLVEVDEVGKLVEWEAVNDSLHLFTVVVFLTSWSHGSGSVCYAKNFNDLRPLPPIHTPPPIRVMCVVSHELVSVCGMSASTCTTCRCIIVALFQGHRCIFSFGIISTTNLYSWKLRFTPS